MVLRSLIRLIMIVCFFLKAISTDICVPISKLPEILLKSEEDVKKYNLNTMVVGHVGDGNFHTFVSIDTDNPEEMKNYQSYTQNLISNALSADGTCTGEHGIGIGK
jgi:D-lactate dehydrogenase (cytochrome)